MAWSEHKQTASAFGPEQRRNQITRCSALHSKWRPATPPPPHNIRVTQIQCVCNLCGIAGQANHANKHHTHSKAAIGQYARTPVGSWHKNHCILTGGSSKMEAFCCHLPDSVTVAVWHSANALRATGYWLLLLLLLMMQIIRNCIDYALGSQLWPLPLPFECQLKWSIKTGCLCASVLNKYIYHMFKICNRRINDFLISMLCAVEASKPSEAN